MCLSEAFYNIVSTFLQSLSKALHTFKPASCLLNADNYRVSFLSFKGLNATTQTFLLVHHAPLNCQLVFQDSLLKKKKQQNNHKQTKTWPWKYLYNKILIFLALTYTLKQTKPKSDQQSTTCIFLTARLQKMRTTLHTTCIFKDCAVHSHNIYQKALHFAAPRDLFL